MSAPRVAMAIARADILERVRRYSFLVTLAATAWLGWLVARGKVALLLDGYHGTMNGAWAGTLVAVTLSSLVSVVGFWIVKGGVERDRATHVGEILAATPMSKATYALGKWLSNFAVLSIIVAALAIVAPILVWLNGGGTIRAWETLSPFVLIALPALATVAALAVLFETFRPLSGGAGNVLWFFLWTALLAIPLATHSPRLDMSGVIIVQQSAGAAAKAVYPDYAGGFSLNVGGGGGEAVKGSFAWSGIEWTSDRIVTRLSWFAIAFVIALVAALPFDRFERGTVPFFRPPRDPRSGEEKRGWSPSLPAILPSAYAGELKLMINGRPWWFWAVFVGFIIAGALTPVAISRGRILPFAWLWPMLAWSAMGAREAKNGTEELVFTAPRPLARQLPALYFAGVTVAVAAGSGVALRCLIAGSLAGLCAWLVGALFIPALALASGVLSGGSKLFEAFYTVLWYLGPLQPVPALDFMGASDAALAARMPLYYFVATAVLLTIAVAGRRLKLIR